jgi:serine/threonine-protein kinase
LDLVRRHGTIRREYSHHTQDSGNVSWLVDTDDGPVFIKTAGTDSPQPVGAPVPYFDHAGRVILLRNAATLARSCNHVALPRLLNVIESPAGPLLVYEAVSGDLVGVPSSERNDPKSAYQRFAHLPGDELLNAFDRLVDLHRSLAEAGWVACDLYDGSLIYDFDAHDLHVVDLDSYRRGPSTNDMGRMFGSTRFMAPEEFQLGAPLDDRTTVYTLGRLIWHFATRLTEQTDTFCGPRSLADVVARATEPDPADRWPSVAALADWWNSARCP